MKSLSENPMFSIVVPTRNRSKLLSRCIDSILNQDYESFELLIVDDGSTDDTRQVLENITDDRIQRFYLDHGERSRARNIGIEKSKGEYVCFVDDDDEITSDYLLEFSKIQNPQKAILRCGFLKRENGKDYKKPLHKESHGHPVTFFAYHMCGVGTLAIPREYLDDDRFAEAFPHWQDTHLFLRLLAKYPFLQLPNYSYVYHIHPEMGSRSSFQEPSYAHTRIELNIQAIEDLFENHTNLISPFLPKNCKSFLVSQKYLQHALNMARKGDKNSAKVYFKKSKDRGLYRSHLKLYILYFKHYFFGKTSSFE